MTRFIPKQFAENSTTSVVFGSFQEQGGHVGDGTISSDPATLQGGTAWPLGWSAATDNFFQIPRGEEMEGLERVLSAAIIQQFKDGLTFWQSEMPVTQYQTIVQYQTGSDLPKLYINITGTSTSTPPDSDTTNWYMFFDTAQVSANIALTNSPYTTNRILEIPQDIKLELNSGTVTLKAGSKLYDGLGGEHIVPSDMSFSTATGSATNQVMLIKTDFSTALFSANNDQDLSYNSTTGLVEYTGLGSYYLPVGITIHSGSTYTGIYQIFNGFGYIGSTVFALPGVKVQFPDGRNEDGTCINGYYTNDSVKTFSNISGTWCGEVWLGTTGLGISDSLKYIPEENRIKHTDGSYRNMCSLGYVFISSGKITSFTPCNIDSVVNSNASNFSQAGRSYLSGLGMPSTKYDNLTVLASGQSYTAPANGYFVYNTAVGGASYVLMSNLTRKIYTADIAGISGTGKTTMRCFVPCHAGDSMTLAYSLSTGSSTTLYFVYAEGEN